MLKMDFLFIKIILIRFWLFGWVIWLVAGVIQVGHTYHKYSYLFHVCVAVIGLSWTKSSAAVTEALAALCWNVECLGCGTNVPKMQPHLSNCLPPQLWGPVCGLCGHVLDCNCTSAFVGGGCGGGDFWARFLSFNKVSSQPNSETQSIITMVTKTCNEGRFMFFFLSGSTYRSWMIHVWRACQSWNIFTEELL